MTAGLLGARWTVIAMLAADHRARCTSDSASTCPSATMRGSTRSACVAYLATPGDGA